MQNMTDGRQGFGTTFTKVLAVFGFIMLVIIGMWGSVTLAKAVPGTLKSIAAAIVSFTSIFVPASETISVTAPSLTIMSGTPVTLSYTHNDKSVDGSYTLRYACVDGVSFTSTQNGSPETLFCNTPFHFIQSGNAVTVIPTSTLNRFVDVEVFVDFTPVGGGSPTVTGSTVITIVNQAVSTSPTTVPEVTTPKPTVTPKPGTQTTTTQPLGTQPGVSNPNGFIDLTARIIEVGVIDKTTGVFTASTTPSRTAFNSRVGIRFAVENLGTKRSPEFAFNAVLPTIPSHIFSSPMQSALNPGDRIEFTLGFDQFKEGSEGEFIVNVDPTGSINEKVEDNNIVKYIIKVNP